MMQNGWRGTMDGDGTRLSRMKSLPVFLCFFFFFFAFGFIQIICYVLVGPHPPNG
jgi:hypothetical protein